jgi:hypothetical protein
MRRCELQMLVLSVPVDVEELLVAGPGVDSLAQAVPGVVGAVGEVEGVGRELGLEPGDVCRGCGDGRMGCGGGGRWRAGAEVAGGRGGGRGQRGEGEEYEQRCGHCEHPQPAEWIADWAGSRPALDCHLPVNIWIPGY